MSRISRINEIENVLVRLIKCEVYFRLCTGHDSEFWAIVQNSLGESVCVFWCHIFGNRKDDLHFSKFFDKRSAFSLGLVKERMLLKLGISESEYSAFWGEVKFCRDKFVSHKELDADVVFPRIDMCRLQAEELRRILSEYSEWMDAKFPNTGWHLWSEYYSLQYLGENQFQAECERDFKKGIRVLPKNLV